MSDRPSSPQTLLIRSPPRSRSNTPPEVLELEGAVQMDILERGWEMEECSWNSFVPFGHPFWRSRRRVSAPASRAADRGYWEGLSPEDKRKQYTCRGYVTLEDITPWQQQLDIQVTLRGPSPYVPNSTLNSKVSLWRGDITSLEIDAIVYAANSSLIGGADVNIHRAASGSLKTECRSLGGGRPGETKITGGHRLPAKYILHTVGPINRSRETLTNCYMSCFHLVKQEQIKSVAFCCIATGVYGYPNEDAAHVALETTREWLVHNADKVDRVIFCVFLEVDYRIYSRLLHDYFPREQLEAAKKEAGVVVAANNEMDDPPPLNRSITEPTGTQPMIAKESSVDSPQPMDTLNSDPTPDLTSYPTPDPTDDMGSSAQPVSTALQWLTDKYQLTTSQINGEIQREDVSYLAACFDNVEYYVDALGLSSGEQTDIIKKTDNHAAMIKCLKIWKSKKLSQATFRALLVMLVKLRKGAIADHVCQYIKEIPTTSVGERHTTGHAALQHTTELTYTDECKDEHIFDISQQMENWVLVAARLGLTAAEIEVIKYDNQSIQVKRLSTLRKWKSKALLSGTCTATYQVLLQALVDCGCNDACSILKNFVDPKL